MFWQISEAVGSDLDVVDNFCDVVDVTSGWTSGNLTDLQWGSNIGQF